MEEKFLQATFVPSTNSYRIYLMEDEDNGKFLAELIPDRLISNEGQEILNQIQIMIKKMEVK